MDESYWKSLDFIYEVIDQIPAGIFWKDRNSNFIGCNQFFAGFAKIANPRDIVGKSEFDLPWGKYQASTYIADDQEVIFTRKPKLNIEEKITLEEGKEFVLLTNKLPLFNKQGDVVGVFGIFHDLTKRKTMELNLEHAKQKAELASRVKTEFIANMSHDIRTPLTGVIGMSQYLHEILDDLHVKQYARWIYESGEQLLSLLNSILDIVSVDEMQDDDLQSEYLELDALLHQLIKLNMPASVSKGISLQLDIASDIPNLLLGDQGKLHRVLLNLLSNAIKFTESGTVQLTCKLLNKDIKHTKLEFKVSDTGIGIPKELQDQVFDRFYKAHPSYEGVFKGYGLGLHIAKKYVELMGGELLLQSTPGKGSTFCFQLNFIIPEIDMESKSEVSQLEQVLTSKLIANQSFELLLVEDNKIARKMLEVFCDGIGVHVDGFETAKAALESFQNKNYDFIITDLGLPDHSGYEFTQMIRAYEEKQKLPKIPIVGLTAHSHSIVNNKCLQVGMQDVVTKPISKETLIFLLSSYTKQNVFSPNEIINPSTFQSKYSDLYYTDYNDFALFDLEKLSTKGIELKYLKELVLLFLHQDLLPNVDLCLLFEKESQLKELLDVVHKIRGGAVYCSTYRLYKASDTLESLLLENEKDKAINFFPTWFLVIHQTIVELEKWLNQA